MTNYPDSPREAARAFTPELTDLINNPLYSDVWTDARLSPRDRSIATLAALTVLYRPEELPVGERDQGGQEQPGRAEVHRHAEEPAQRDAGAALRRR